MKLVNQENFDELIKKIESEGGGSSPRSKFDGGGGGGDNFAMEARVSALEEVVKNLPTKADLDALRQGSKADITEVKLGLKSDLLAAESALIKWIVGVAIGLGAAGITVMTFVLNNAVPKTPTAISQPAAGQQPIIINVPSASTPPAPQKP